MIPMEDIRQGTVYLIDGRRQPEQYFWNCLHILATEAQKEHILEGLPVRIGGSCYRMLPGGEE
jgi:hypothetical protein